MKASNPGPQWEKSISIPQLSNRAARRPVISVRVAWTYFGNQLSVAHFKPRSTSMSLIQTPLQQWSSGSQSESQCAVVVLTGAACGGLEPPPAGRFRRTYLHHLHSSDSEDLHTRLLRRSWHTTCGDAARHAGDGGLLGGHGPGDDHE